MQSRARLARPLGQPERETVAALYVTVYDAEEGSVGTAVNLLKTPAALKEASVAFEVAVEARTKLLRVIASLK